MRTLVTMLLGISLLGAPAMFAAAKKHGGGEKEKDPAAAKAAKAGKNAKDIKSTAPKTKSAAEQKTQK